jgi:hypothetical protein
MFDKLTDERDDDNETGVTTALPAETVNATTVDDNTDKFDETS